MKLVRAKFLFFIVFLFLKDSHREGHRVTLRYPDAPRRVFLLFFFWRMGTIAPVQCRVVPVRIFCEQKEARKSGPKVSQGLRRPIRAALLLEGGFPQPGLQGGYWFRSRARLRRLVPPGCPHWPVSFQCAEFRALPAPVVFSAVPPR